MLLLCLQYPLLLIFLGIAVLFLSTGFLLYTFSIAKRASFAFWCFFLSGAFLLAFIMAGFVFSIPTEELLFWVVLFLLGFQALFHCCVSLLFFKAEIKTKTKAKILLYHIGLITNPQKGGSHELYYSLFLPLSAISTSALLAVTQTFPLCFTAFGFCTILWLGSSLAPCTDRYRDPDFLCLRTFCIKTYCHLLHYGLFGASRLL